MRNVEPNSLPETWRLPHLEEVSEIRYGLGQPPQQADDGVPMIRATNVKRGRISEEGLIRIKRSAIPESRNPFLKSGDVIVVRSGAYTGDVAMITEKWAGSIAGYDLVVSPAEPIDSAYCAYALLSSPVQRHFKGLSNRAAQSHLNRQQLQRTPIPLPPLPEQKKIAHILSTVQRAIEAQERIIQTTTELKKALMHKLFTEGLPRRSSGGDGPLIYEPQKQTEIGFIPQSWEVVELGSLAKVGNGSTPKRGNPEYWEGGLIPWLNSTKIHDRFITEADQFVTAKAVKECHLPRVAPNSLLIAITGQGKTLGNSAITRIETCINQHLAYAQFHCVSVVPEFVLWFMHTRYDYLRSIAHGGGSTKGALTCGFLKTLPIPVPSIEEQLEIVMAFQTLEDKCRSASGKRAALHDLFRTLLHQLMTAQLRTQALT